MIAAVGSTSGNLPITLTIKEKTMINCRGSIKLGTACGKCPRCLKSSGKYENTNPLSKLHKGEPYFFLRAQDMHSSFAVRQYADAVGVLDAKAKSECIAFAERMEAWQDANPDKVKQPD